jgi:hypothetical protein
MTYQIIPQHVWLRGFTYTGTMWEQPGVKVLIKQSEEKYSEAFDWALTAFGEDLRCGFWESKDQTSRFIVATDTQALMLKLTWAGL